jgi:hypothetical protein
MIHVGDILVSDDIASEEFVCNLTRCKGACCVEGEYGAPLEDDELPILREIYPRVRPYLSEAGIRSIEVKGTYVLDEEGDFSTPTIGKAECAYSVYDEKGILKCGIEKAWSEGKISYRKPISCHLYPIRITKKKDFEAVNYHRWDVCSPACELGKSLKVPLYVFLKDALVRKYGEQWYEGLVKLIEQPEPSGRET